VASVGLRVRANRRRVTATALLLALTAHVLFLAILVWQRPSADRLGPGEVVNIELTARPPKPPKTRSPLSSQSLHVLASPSTRPVPPPPATATPVQPTAPMQPAPTEAPGPQPQVADSDVRKALRGAFGCSFAAMANLTPDERQHCQERFNANRQGLAVREFGVDPAKRAIFEANAKRALWWQEPFLATTPKNSCAPNVGNQQIAIPGGAHAPSAWRVGVSCGKSF
jgi:hypothetical protein